MPARRRATFPPDCNAVAKKKAYICSVKQSRIQTPALVALLLLLLVTLAPHHHHDDGAPCWTTEVCPEDGHVNDRHTEHGRNAHADCHALFLTSSHKATTAAPRHAGGPAHPFAPCLAASFGDFSFSYIYKVCGTPRFSEPPLLSTRRVGASVTRRGPPQG